MVRFISYKLWTLLVLFILLKVGKANLLAQQLNNRDTILSYAMIYNGDTIEAKTLVDINFYSRLTQAQRDNQAKWNRLRNAVYVTYPYARRAGMVINDRKLYIKTREKELRKEFTTPLTNLSIYQGKVLMKLINRETGNNCFEIIREYKGGLTAGLYQTVAFFFSTSLKQPYDKNGEDFEIEKIVQEVERLYGIRG